MKDECNPDGTYKVSKLFISKFINDIKKDALGTVLKEESVKEIHKVTPCTLVYERVDGLEFLREIHLEPILEAQAQHTASILCPQYFEAGKKEALKEAKDFVRIEWDLIPYIADGISEEKRSSLNEIIALKFHRLLENWQGKFPEEE